MIAIVDYGLGNVTAFAHVFDRLSQPVIFARTPDDLRPATKIVLPGVGSFDYCMQRLEDSGMTELLTSMVVERKTPVLGVCVGMQMLARRSEEGSRAGLGWVDGEVKKFATSPSHGVRIPHMGWNNVAPGREHGLLARLDDSSRFYFLHSYYFVCDDDNAVLATTEYAGRFACAIARDNIFGVQFHPEKSHRWGTQLLDNFARL